MPDAIAAPTGQERRERFRAYMRAFNPSAPPAEAIKNGLILEDLHESLHRNLAARADLEPGSQQLLVGGIGSGKSTELLLAANLLSQDSRILPLYIDVTSETDLSELNSGALLASFGLRLASEILKRDLSAHLTPSEISQLQVDFEKIKEFAYGTTKFQWVPDEDDLYEREWDDHEEDHEPGRYIQHRIEGKLKRPFPALKREIKEIRDTLESFNLALKRINLEIVAIFDGLDRLILPDRFWAVVEQDLRSLKKFAVSVLVTGPISVLYGVGRSITDYFDKVHHMPAIAAESKHLIFLHSLLQKRGSALLLDSDLAGRICYASGGVLRDLITLARDSGEEAYVSGADMIHNQHVENAIAQLGTAYRRGLGREQLKILTQLAKNGNFNPGTPVNVELLVTRRVLEYSATNFRIHPSLVPLLQE